MHVYSSKLVRKVSYRYILKMSDPNVVFLTIVWIEMLDSSN